MLSARSKVYVLPLQKRAPNTALTQVKPFSASLTVLVFGYLSISQTANRLAANALVDGILALVAK
jgi:hypothetical protein